MDVSLYITITMLSSYRLLTWFFQTSHTYTLIINVNRWFRKYKSSVMFLCEAGKAESSEFLNLL